MKPSIMFVLLGLSLCTYTSKAMEEAMPENSTDLSEDQLPSDPAQLKKAILLAKQIQQSLTAENNELSQENQQLQEELNKLKQGNEALVTHLRKLVQQTTQRSQYTTTLETENKDLQAVIKYLQMLILNTDILQEQRNMAKSLDQLVAIQSEQLEFNQHKWAEKQLFLRATFALNLLNSNQSFLGPDADVQRFTDEHVDALRLYITEYKPREKHSSTPPIEIINPKKVAPRVPHNTQEFHNTSEYDDDLYANEYFDPQQELLLETLDNVV